MKISIIVLTLLIYTVKSQKFDFSSDPCPNLPAMTNFNETAFLGRWLEYKKYYAVYEPFAICVINNVSVKKNTFTVVHTHTDFNPPAFVPMVNTDTKYLTYVGDKSLAHFRTTYNFLGFIKVPKIIDYKILETDYENYAVSYACMDIKMCRLKFAWIWVRNKKPNLTATNKALEVLSRNNITTSGMMYTYIYSCF